jgi:hypothetical protein
MRDVRDRLLIFARDRRAERGRNERADGGAREQYSYTRIQLRLTFPSFVGTCKYLRWRYISIMIECFATSATDMISIVSYKCMVGS